MQFFKDKSWGGGEGVWVPMNSNLCTPQLVLSTVVQNSYKDGVQETSC